MSKAREKIFGLGITSPEGVLMDEIALTVDDDGRIYLEDQPMTVGEARHLWNALEYALCHDSQLDAFRKLVWIRLADAGTTQEHVSGR